MHIYNSLMSDYLAYKHKYYGEFFKDF